MCGTTPIRVVRRQTVKIKNISAGTKENYEERGRTAFIQVESRNRECSVSVLKSVAIVLTEKSCDKLRKVL